MFDYNEFVCRVPGIRCLEGGTFCSPFLNLKFLAFAVDFEYFLRKSVKQKNTKKSLTRIRHPLYTLFGRFGSVVFSHVPNPFRPKR
jgi:hypothetical protein